MIHKEKIAAIKKRNGAPAISVITAYDFPTAKIAEEAGIDIILVGDSLGMVVLGFPDTTHVTLDMMLHHTAAAARGATKTPIISDLPIHSYDTPEQATDSAKKLVEAGADLVKLEGGHAQVDKIRAIMAASIPVVGHLGMLPQRIKEEGKYRKKGKTTEESEHILTSALALEQAGCTAIVLESVIPELAEKVTRSLKIPTIGIGCKPKSGEQTCDGEVAVITDVIGSYPWFVPPFATPKANVAEITRDAIKSFINSI